MSFSSPIYLLLLLVPLAVVAWHFLFVVKREATFKVAFSAEDYTPPTTWRRRLVHAPFYLKILSMVALILALARPQTNFAINEEEVEGIDIMLSLDISVSMLAPDFEPNRMEAAKQVAQEFISQRPNDNIGLTLFGGEAFTKCPLTTDHATLLGMFPDVGCHLQQQGIISQGTAIGMGIANATAHLEQSSTKTKIIILLTDGENNTGEISPMTAAQMAKELGIRIYTIAIGSDAATEQSIATLPNGEEYKAMLPPQANDNTLETIAETTGGIAYRADDLKALRNIYEEIDKLEKSKLSLQQRQHKFEAYQPFALAAFLLLILALALQYTIFRKLP